jgi:hypothetical protein
VVGDGSGDGFSNTGDEEAIEIAVALQPYRPEKEKAVRIFRMRYYWEILRPLLEMVGQRRLELVELCL